MNKSDPNSVDPTRRKLFKALLGGGALLAGAGALPERWVKPLVQTVIVPAHARLSGMYVLAAGNTETGIAIDAPATTTGPQPTPATLVQNLYVCVSPSPDGTKADIDVYLWLSGIDGCADKAISMIGGKIVSVDVPSYGNDIDLNPICAPRPAPDTAGTGDLLDRLGIIRSAHAVPPAVKPTVDILSVSNGAEGYFHPATFTGPAIPAIHFVIPPADGCFPPECCPAPI
jgi:hypothetical protein